MSLQRAFAIAADGLSAQRTRMETVSSNLANARSTRSAEGGPYRRLMPVFASLPVSTAFRDGQLSSLRSVGVERIVTDDAPPLLKFEPGHPDADASGFVAYPNIDMVKEMVDMVSAVRTYEANVTAVRNVREMGRAALEIIT